MHALHEFSRKGGLKLFLLPLLILGILSPAMARDSGNLFTIYLVRHAEKVADPSHPDDPGLSDCGNSRAEGLATILGDAKLEKIYSTDYRRTRATAWPAARRLSLEIEFYDPGELEALSLMLLHQHKDALVVGHSNTTPVLAGLLAGETLEPFDESIYDRLYVVTVAESRSRMTLLHQGFRCDS